MPSGPTDDYFRGFMVQGRMAADGTTPVGTFGSSGKNYKSVCKDEVRIFKRFYL